MEPALDEASLVPCPTTPPAVRIARMADTLKALDRLGSPRVLLSVRDAADRALADGHGLRHWCFDRRTPRDAGRFVAQRLDKAPYLDGPDGLFATVEAGRAVQPSIEGVPSLGGGHVALTDSVLVILSGSTWPPAKPVLVRLEVLTEEDEWVDEVRVDAADCAEEIGALAASILHKIEAAVSSGTVLIERLPELCPRIVLGARAAEQLSKMTGSEPIFPQVLRHLRALDRAAEKWTPGTPFEPSDLTYSPESDPTLKHPRYGPMRDFPTPQGFVDDRWTLHSKIPTGEGARIYFKYRDSGAAPSTEATMRVAVGYVGPHLQTVRFR